MPSAICYYKFFKRYDWIDSKIGSNYRTSKILGDFLKYFISFLCKIFTPIFCLKNTGFFFDKIKLSDILVSLILSFGWGGVGCF